MAACGAMRFLRVSSDAPEPAGAFLPPGCATSSGRPLDAAASRRPLGRRLDRRHQGRQAERAVRAPAADARVGRRDTDRALAKLAAALVGGGRATRGHGARIVADAVSDADDIGTPFNSSFGTSWDLRHLFSFAPPCNDPEPWLAVHAPWSVSQSVTSSVTIRSMEDGPTRTHTLHTIGSGADTRHAVTGVSLGPDCWTHSSQLTGQLTRWRYIVGLAAFFRKIEKRVIRTVWAPTRWPSSTRVAWASPRAPSCLADAQTCRL